MEGGEFWKLFWFGLVGSESLEVTGLLAQISEFVFFGRFSELLFKGAKVIYSFRRSQFSSVRTAMYLVKPLPVAGLRSFHFILSHLLH